jgi:hypothetical protein
MVNLDSYIDKVRQYGRALAFIFNSKPNPVSVRDGTIRLFVRGQILFTIMAFVIELSSVWHGFLFILDNCFIHDKRYSGCPYTP